MTKIIKTKIDVPKVVVAAAINAAKKSPCCKSKRGVAIYTNHNDEIEILSTGWNYRPCNMCDNDFLCKERCYDECIHAEQDAIGELLKICIERRFGLGIINDLELLHIALDNDLNILNDKIIPCCVQCAKSIFASPIKKVHLYSQNGTVTFTKNQFYTETIKWNRDYPSEQINKLKKELLEEKQKRVASELKLNLTKFK